MNRPPRAGIVFLDKPHGWTSREAVNAVRRILSPWMDTRLRRRRHGLRAGHAGTLDPLASGMLPILLGEATRFADLGLQADKRYRVDIDLSMRTDTLDTDGHIQARFDIAPSEAELRQVLREMCGELWQVPPEYSAIRIDGRRAHHLARQGKEVHLDARRVRIHRLQLLRYEFPLLRLDVHCSKGTYIRALARDIGANLGCGGCVSALRRLATGGWTEDLMCTIEQLEQAPLRLLQPLSLWVRDWPSLQLDMQMARRFAQGQRLALPAHGHQPEEVAIYVNGRLLGLARIERQKDRCLLHPRTVLSSALEDGEGQEE